MKNFPDRSPLGNRNATLNMKSTLAKMIRLSLLTALAVMLVSSSKSFGATAPPPERMSYQGFLVDDGGTPIGATPVNREVIFRVFDALEGGNLIWSERQIVTINRGYFNVMLGEGSQVDAEPHGLIGDAFIGPVSERFMETTVVGLTQGVDNPITPRVKMLTSPFSFLAKRAVNADFAQQLVNTGNTIDLSNPFSIRVNAAIQSAGGDNRGERAVDLQVGRANNDDVAAGLESVVGGGGSNRAGGNHSTVGGGANNVADGAGSTISGGANNLSSGHDSTVGGGFENHATGLRSTIGGGVDNLAAEHATTVAGGWLNEATVAEAAIAGGAHNRAWKLRAFVGGGATNIADGDYSVISGGRANHATWNHSTIGGGSLNKAFAIHSTVGGGSLNEVHWNGGTIAGGYDNLVHLADSGFIGGGYSNEVAGLEAVVVGGTLNRATEGRSLVGGGLHNHAQGVQSVVGGGHDNVASGLNSSVLGGYQNTAAGSHSVAMGRRAKANHSGSFVWADEEDVDFTSSENNEFSVRASRIRLVKGYMRIESGAQTTEEWNNGGVLPVRTYLEMGRSLDGNHSWRVSEEINAAYGDRGGLMFNFRGVNPGNNNAYHAFVVSIHGEPLSGSDRRFKKDITPAEGLLEKVKSIEPVNYRLNGMGGDSPKKIGVIAQDLEKQFPELVSEVGGMKHVNYSFLSSVAVGAIKELDAEKDKEIAELKEENDTLKNQMAEMLKRLQALESKVK